MYCLLEDPFPIRRGLNTEPFIQHQGIPLGSGVELL